MAGSPSRRHQLLVVSVASLALLSLLARSATSAAAQQTNSLRGFAPASAARERVMEGELARRLNRDSTGAFFKYFTDVPHPAGSARNKELADFMAARWRALRAGRGARPPLRRPPPLAA